MVKQLLHHFSRMREGGDRVFGHGQLRLVLLQMLADKPSHGYELIRAIEERLQGRYSPSPGTVYPTLTMLEEQDFIVQAEQEAGRKVFSATDAGRAFLQENREMVDAVLARMDQGGGHGPHGMHGHHRGGHPPQVLRALENLKLAVRLRMHGAPLTPDQASAFAAVLDTAAQQIERI
jgi:DNA-binding PadR family transcriptional regulator